jgi:hypothetical protein
MDARCGCAIHFFENWRFALAPGIRSRWKRLVWICAGVALGLILVILAGGWFELRYRGQRELEAAIAETDHLHPNWRLEDLEASRGPMLPPDQNGLKQLESAAAAMPKGPWPQIAAPQFDQDPRHRNLVAGALSNSLEKRDRFRPTLLNQEQAKALRPELIRARESLTLLRALISFSRGRGPTIVPDGYKPVQTNLPNYLAISQVARMLLPDTRVRVFDGDIGGGLQNVRALLHMSIALENELSLFPQLIRGSIDGLVVDQLEIVLAGGISTEAELAPIQGELEHDVAETKCLPGILGERARFDYMVERLQEKGVSSEELRAYLGPVSVGPRSVSASLIRELRFARIVADLAGVRAGALRTMNEAERIAKLPLHERPRERKALAARWAGGPFDLGQNAVSWAHQLEDELKPTALIRCSIVAVAMERFRLANKRWPDTLQELTPRYLQTIPLDPFDGKPLRMVTKGTYRIVYSIGPNLVDDGGTFKPKPGADGMDLGFILHDADQRRRPGPPFVYPSRESKDEKSAKPEPKSSGSGGSHQ